MKELMRCLCLSLVLCLGMNLQASPTEKAREIALKYKKEGYINIRSEKSGRLNESGRVSFSGTLLKGMSYVAVVGSEDHVSKIGVYVFDEKRNRIPLSNKFVNKGSSLVFKPKKDGRYTFLIMSKSPRVNYKFYLISKSPSWMK